MGTTTIAEQNGRGPTTGRKTHFIALKNNAGGGDGARAAILEGTGIVPEGHGERASANLLRALEV